MDHLNNPDESVLEQSGIVERPYLWSIHGGSKIKLTKSKFSDRVNLYPNFIFAHQGDFNQINAGSYLQYENILAGLWFRHTNSNADALIFSVGYKKGPIRIGYSYDWTISSLEKTGGAHEVGIVYDFAELPNMKLKFKSKKYNNCLELFK